MSGGSSRGRYGDRMGVWNGPVNEHVTADLFVRTVFGEANAFHLEFAAVLESAKSQSRAAYWRGVAFWIAICVSTASLQRRCRL